ncbi:MAG TPA: OBAP family protein [Telluria sp.]
MRLILAGALAAALAACGGKTTESKVTPPGDAQAPQTRALEVGADLLQNKPPIEAINAYLDGFHFYNGNMKAQMEAHHYCTILNEDVIQCVIYDANTAGAKLMGVEYIISGKLFQTLPGREKAFWHSHVHEVKSGSLVAPGIPQVAEHALMKKLVGTYGKTWHTWHTDRKLALPFGAPQLMMGFTADGQISEAMVADRDKRFSISSTDKRKQRADIPSPPIDPGADAWQHGMVYQMQDPSTAPPQGGQTSAPAGH